MDFLNMYGFFLAKLISIVIAILVIFAGIIAIGGKDKLKGSGKLSIKCLNNLYHGYAKALLHALQEKEHSKQLKRDNKKHSKTKNKKRLFVIDFYGDIRASQVDALREEITAVLLVADPSTDEVLIRLESAGGMVNAYGLAASQLHRIRAANIKLTIAIDKVAASGGYMMACLANEIIAAPFAVVGSIGVIAQLPNFHDFLRHKHINFEQITAGEYKRTLTMFGENTEKGREKMQQEVNETLALFKSHIGKFRSKVNLSEVATGEHWFAEKAIDLNLVDTLNTSDDFLLGKNKDTQIFSIEYKQKKSLSQKFIGRAWALLHNTFKKHSSGQDYL